MPVSVPAPAPIPVLNLPPEKEKKEKLLPRKLEFSKLQNIKEEDDDENIGSTRKNTMQNPIKPIWDEELIIQPKVELDRSEPIIMASFVLPYNVQRSKDGELFIQKCILNPIMLYGTLENMQQKRQYNFHWVGLATTLEDFTQQEKEELEAKFKSIGAYPVFMSAEELHTCMLYYENILRPLFHNFKDIRDMRNDYLKYWKDYLSVN